MTLNKVYEIKLNINTHFTITLNIDINIEVPKLREKSFLTIFNPQLNLQFFS